MKKENHKFTVFAIICSFLMLTILCISLNSEKNGALVLNEKPYTQTSTVYVYVTPETNIETSTESIFSNGWIIREYEGQIGVFTLDEVLINILPVYTKTLPIADRDLLREGITVTTREELLAIIEDYSG